VLHYLDQHRIRRAFQRAAQNFNDADFLHREVGRRLLERLELIALNPSEVADLGAGTLGDACRLKKRYIDAQVTAIDFAPKMLSAGSANDDETGTVSAVCANASRLPFHNACFDLVFSSLMLHWCPDVVTVLRETRRVLDFPGLFCFATFGPDTLRELGEAWREIDHFSHISPFVDMHDLGDMLVDTGFVEPVVDRELITVTYGSLAGLMRDLKGVGSINATVDRNRGLTGRTRWQKLSRQFEKNRDPDGRIPVTLEMVYAQAWAAPVRPGTEALGDGRLQIPVEVIP